MTELAGRAVGIARRAAGLHCGCVRRDAVAAGLGREPADAADGWSSQRQVTNPAFPLALEAAGRQDQKVIERLAHWSELADHHDTGHWASPRDAIVDVPGHGGRVVGEQDATIRSGPVEDGWVVSSGQADVLHADEIEPGLPTEQSA